MNDKHFYQVVSVSVAAFPGTAQCIIHDTAGTQLQKRGGLMLISRSADTNVEYSFDGVTVHGLLAFEGPEKALAFDEHPLDRIWFRAATGTHPVAVRAWDQG